MNVRFQILLLLVAVDFKNVNSFEVLTENGELPGKDIADGKDCAETARDLLTEYVQLDRNWLEMNFCGLVDDPRQHDGDQRIIRAVLGSFIPSTTTLLRGQWAKLNDKISPEHASIIRQGCIALSAFGHGNGAKSKLVC